jgi:hypothetical protein
MVLTARYGRCGKCLEKIRAWRSHGALAGSAWPTILSLPHSSPTTTKMPTYAKNSTAFETRSGSIAAASRFGPARLDVPRAVMAAEDTTRCV